MNHGRIKTAGLVKQLIHAQPLQSRLFDLGRNPVPGLETALFCFLLVIIIQAKVIAFAINRLENVVFALFLWLQQLYCVNYFSLVFFGYDFFVEAISL